MKQQKLRCFQKVLYQNKNIHKTILKDSPLPQNVTPQITTVPCGVHEICLSHIWVTMDRYFKLIHPPPCFQMNNSFLYCGRKTRQNHSPLPFEVSMLTCSCVFSYILSIHQQSSYWETLMYSYLVNNISY